MEELRTKLDKLNLDSDLDLYISSPCSVIIHGPARCGKTCKLMNVLLSMGIQ